ncbi:glycoside hydrolase family 32 protein [Streptomyces dangxiongensis]|uniref:Glycoside hydrolase family 32 protein n=1 Tax=Streptomyces dangxiongensis TaxID=1442032 RepID=A0A3G2JDL7_9ACTN|nr:glycoside hydrolase family 32 protein [Streptomyces dangxiongensis]AYN38612.1 glycoside hydrolase family 32 protein [Streptomyces dangxiongensis]
MSSGRVSRHARTRMIAAVTTVCALSAAPLAPQAAAADSPTYSETYRPQFHFTPEKNWMNDPNGLVHYKGEYHLFYQYNPNGNSWGDMSWGHAVSKDLVHWKQLPLALSYDDNEMVFSGSAVVDWNNTTGFGTKKNPPMVAIYTSYNRMTGIQAQSIAHSTDRGRTWTKYQGNPVLDIGSKEFRDPKVQWYAPTKSWLMTVSLSTEHKVRFYSSKNLKDWKLLSEFGPSGATGGVWECPDLFPLAVDGDEKKIKWVLVVNINPGGITGGSGAQYFVGDFDGEKFTAEPWRSAQSIPREMALRTVDGRIRLTGQPVDSLASLREKHPATASGVTVKSTSQTLIGPAAKGEALDIEATFSLKDADHFGLKVRTGADGEETVIGYDTTTQELYVDRTNSGAVDFSDAFPGVQRAPLKAKNGKVKLRILVDRSSVEVFGGSGEAVITDQIFPDSASQGVQVFAENGSVKLDRARVWHLDSYRDRPRPTSTTEDTAP